MVDNSSNSMISNEEMNTGNTRTLVCSTGRRKVHSSCGGGRLDYMGDRARTISEGNQSREGSLFFIAQHQCKLLQR